MEDDELRKSVKNVKDAAYQAYAGQTRNYKQKLLYGLLGAMRNKDRSRFMNILDVNLNGVKGAEQVSMARCIMNEYENIQGPHFETYAYSIIAGILASKDEKI